jgi:hypothetical protein
MIHPLEILASWVVWRDQQATDIWELGNIHRYK